MENMHTDVKVKRVNVLDSESRGLGKRFGWYSVLCSRARQHISKTGIPSSGRGGGILRLLVLSCYRNWDKLLLYRPLASRTDFTYVPFPIGV